MQIWSEQGGIADSLGRECPGFWARIGRRLGGRSAEARRRMRWARLIRQLDRECDQLLRRMKGPA